MKFKAAVLIAITVIISGCFHSPTDHDLRVIAKKFIRKQLVSPSTATFSPDDKITITREPNAHTYSISMYSDDEKASGKKERRNWDLHLLYKGGALVDTKNWEIIK